MCSHTGCWLSFSQIKWQRNTLFRSHWPSFPFVLLNMSVVCWLLQKQRAVILQRLELVCAQVSAPECLVRCLFNLSLIARPGLWMRAVWTFQGFPWLAPWNINDWSLGTLEARGNSWSFCYLKHMPGKGGGRIGPPWPGMCSREIPPKVEHLVGQPPGKGVLAVALEIAAWNPLSDSRRPASWEWRPAFCLSTKANKGRRNGAGFSLVSMGMDNEVYILKAFKCVSPLEK